MTEKTDLVTVVKDNTIFDLEEIMISLFEKEYGVTPRIKVDFTFYFPEISITASLGEDLDNLFTVFFDSENEKIYFDSPSDIDGEHRDTFDKECFKEKYLEFLKSWSLKRLMSLYLGYHDHEKY